MRHTSDSETSVNDTPRPTEGHSEFTQHLKVLKMANTAENPSENATMHTQSDRFKPMQPPPDRANNFTRGIRSDNRLPYLEQTTVKHIYFFVKECLEFIEDKFVFDPRAQMTRTTFEIVDKHRLMADNEYRQISNATEHVQLYDATMKLNADSFETIPTMRANADLATPLSRDAMGFYKHANTQHSPMTQTPTTGGAGGTGGGNSQLNMILAANASTPMSVGNANTTFSQQATSTNAPANTQTSTRSSVTSSRRSTRRLSARADTGEATPAQINTRGNSPVISATSVAQTPTSELVSIGNMLAQAIKEGIQELKQFASDTRKQSNEQQDEYNIKHPKWDTTLSDHLTPREWLLSILAAQIKDETQLYNQMMLGCNVSRKFINNAMRAKELQRRWYFCNVWLEAYLRAKHLSNEAISWVRVVTIFKNAMPEDDSMKLKLQMGWDQGNTYDIWNSLGKTVAELILNLSQLVDEVVPSTNVATKRVRSETENTRSKRQATEERVHIYDVDKPRHSELRRNCRDFLNGNCKRGASCKFYHDNEKLAAEKARNPARENEWGSSKRTGNANTSTTQGWGNTNTNTANTARNASTWGMRKPSQTQTYTSKEVVVFDPQVNEMSAEEKEMRRLISQNSSMPKEEEDRLYEVFMQNRRVVVAEPIITHSKKVDVQYVTSKKAANAKDSITINRELREFLDSLMHAKFDIRVNETAGRSVNAYIDTGAQINMMTLKLAKELQALGLEMLPPFPIRVGTWNKNAEYVEPVGAMKLTLLTRDPRPPNAHYDVVVHVLEQAESEFAISDHTALRLGLLSGFLFNKDKPDKDWEKHEWTMRSPAEWLTPAREVLDTFCNASQEILEHQQVTIKMVQTLQEELKKLEKSRDPHALEMNDSMKSSAIPTEEQGNSILSSRILKALTREYYELLGEIPKELPEFMSKHLLKLTLKDPNDLPKAMPPRNFDKVTKDAFDAWIDKMLKAGFIEECEAKHPSCLVAIPKPDKTIRVCLDARPTNAKVEDLQGSLPDQWLLVMECVGYDIFSVIDMVQFFQQAGMEVTSKQFCEFIAYRGGKAYRFIRVPFGLKMATIFMQRIMEDLFADMPGVKIFVDDIIILSHTKEQHYEDCCEVFRRLRNAGLRFNTKKCKFAWYKLDFLGRQVSKQCMTITDKYREKLINCEKPVTVKDMKSWYGKVGWVRVHLPMIAVHMRVLSQATKQGSEKSKTQHKKHKLIWSREMHEAWVLCADILRNPIPLSKFDQNRLTFIETDASTLGIGAFLYQKEVNSVSEDGYEERYPIAFLSMAFDATQQRWATYDQELFAIVQACEKWNYLLANHPFTVYSDHANLQHWDKHATNKIKRWTTRLQAYPMKIVHIKGEDNYIADTLSRHGFTELHDDSQAGTFVAAKVKTRSAKHSEQMKQDDEVESIDDDELFRSNVDMLTNNCDSDAMRTDESGIDESGESTDTRQKVDMQGVSNAVFSMFHNDIVGHRGAEQMKKILKEKKIQWRGMTSELRAFCKACITCQLNSHRKSTLGSTSNIAVEGPMVELAMDTIGPLVSEKEDPEYRYILCFVDTFTRFCNLVPIKNLSALEAADALLKVVGIFGCPSAIKSDHGTQFDNQLMRNLHKLMGVESKYSIAYRHQSNGIVERLNGEVGRHLRALIFDKRVKRTDFHKWLPIVQRIINASHHSSIGAKPAQLMFGKRFDIDRVLLPGNANSGEWQGTGPVLGQMRSYYNELVDMQEKLLDTSILHQRETLQRRAKILEQNETREQLKQGDYVIAKPQVAEHKLAMPKQGPYMVLDWNHSTTTALLSAPYSVKANAEGNIVRNKGDLIKCDLSNLDRPLDSKIVAPDEWEVEQVIDHKRYDERPMWGLSCYVRWADFGPEHDQWIRADHIPRAILQTYIESKGGKTPTDLK